MFPSNKQVVQRLQAHNSPRTASFRNLCKAKNNLQYNWHLSRTSRWPKYCKCKCPIVLWLVHLQYGCLSLSLRLGTSFGAPRGTEEKFQLALLGVGHPSAGLFPFRIFSAQIRLGGFRLRQPRSSGSACSPKATWRRRPRSRIRTKSNQRLGFNPRETPTEDVPTWKTWK